MDLFLKVTAGVLLSVILFLILNPHCKELGMLISLAVGCMVAIAAGHFIEPVVGVMDTVQQVGDLDNTYLSILLKVVAIGFLSEIAALVCTDAGNATLGKTLQMLAACVILWLSIPLLNSLLELIQGILGEV